jgi:hypothetical protein
MNILKFPTPEKVLSEQEQIEIARQEIIAEFRLMEAQGLIEFEVLDNPSCGEVVPFIKPYHLKEIT